MNTLGRGHLHGNLCVFRLLDTFLLPSTTTLFSSLYDQHGTEGKVGIPASIKIIYDQLCPD